MPVHQRGADDAQQAGPGQIGFADASLAIEGQVAHRGEIVEIGDLFQHRLQLTARARQFRVLHLQLDLVDLQLIEQPLRVGVGAG